MTSKYTGLLCLLLATGSCKPPSAYSGSLNTPGPLAVLQVADTSPFTTSVGYAADRHGGRIRVLDLNRGIYLADAGHASFLRGNTLATGADRIINSLAAASPTPSSAVVLATDTHFNQLIVMSHVSGLQENGQPKHPQAEVASIVLQNPDDQGMPYVEILGIDHDRLTPDHWQITWDGQSWTIQSTYSGTSTLHGRYGVIVTPDGGLTLQLGGSPTPGDGALINITRADMQLVDLSSTPLAVAVSPDAEQVIVTQHADDHGVRVRVGTLAPFALDRVIALPAAAKPGRIDFDIDGRALVADAGMPGAWQIDLQTGHAVHIDLPWPTADLTAVRANDGTQRLVVVPADRTSVWLYDLENDVLIDTNPATPDVDGMPMYAPINGVAALNTAYALPFHRDPATGIADSSGRRGTSAAIALASGSIVWMNADTGCLVSDQLGPRSDVINVASSLSDYTANYTVRQPGTAYLAATADSSHHVVGSHCAGRTPTESWFLTYDAIEGAWAARGTVSGIQDYLVLEGSRYVSDQGEISLFIVPGATPSEDAWRLAFNMIDGVLQADGSQVSSSVQSQRSRGRNLVTPQGYVYSTASSLSLEMPGDPVVFARHQSGTLNGHVIVPQVIVAAQSADVVVRIDPRTATIDALWD